MEKKNEIQICEGRNHPMGSEKSSGGMTLKLAF